jgi:hypothetical protein
MKEKIFRYYLYTVGAITIPIIVYILYPGVSGIPSVISALLVFFVFLKMRKVNLLTNVNVIENFKWLLLVIMLGAVNSVIHVEHNHFNIALLIGHLLSWLMLCVCYMIKDIKSVYSFATAYLFILLPTAFLSAISWSGFLLYDVPHILLPLSLFLLVCPFLAFKLRVIIVLALVASFIYDSSSRSCLLTMGFCFFLFISYYLFSKRFVPNFLKTIRILFFIIPILFLILGVSGRFNVFAGVEELDVSEYNLESRKSDTHMLNTDSRTGVYMDVLASIEGPADILFGKGVVIILPSAWTDDRNSVEAEILNLYLRYGLIGCVVFFSLLWRISKKGMYETKNTLTMLISAYIAYRFMFMFIEDAGINPSIYVALGICLNPTIRNMTDKEIKKSLELV